MKMPVRLQNALDPDEFRVLTPDEWRALEDQYEGERGQPRRTREIPASEVAKLRAQLAERVRAMRLEQIAVLSEKKAALERALIEADRQAALFREEFERTQARLSKLRHQVEG